MSRPPLGDPGVGPTMAVFSLTTNQSPIGGDFSTAWIRLSSGMEVAQDRSPVGPLPAPQGLEAITSESEGEVETKCDAVFGASSYVFECAANPNGPWTQIDVSSRASALATGLTSGTKYWFHVRAVGAAGPGRWSEPVVKMAA